MSSDATLVLVGCAAKLSIVRLRSVREGVCEGARAKYCRKHSTKRSGRETWHAP